MSANNKSTARSLAVQVLVANEKDGTYVDLLLENDAHVRTLASRDMALLRELVFGVLRNRSFLDLHIRNYIRRGYDTFDVKIKNILRVAFYQLLFLDRVPDYAVISEAVEQAKNTGTGSQAKLVNGVLRTFQREPWKPELSSAADLQEIAEYMSHPLWLVTRFVEQFGAEELLPWLKANNRVPVTFLRHLHAQEACMDPELQSTDFDGYFAMPAGLRLQMLKGWQTGRYIVQDPSAGLAVALLAAGDGERIIDLCAAPGGKAVALANLVGPEGRIVAVEIEKKRLGKIHENVTRTGAENVEIVQADARTVELDAADAVLVDAPCSGFGVMARKPDIRWLRKPEDMRALLRLQRHILHNAAGLVKPGGRLIYSTCTTDREENEMMVTAFLQQHREFALENAGEFVPERFVTERGFVRSWPHLHGIDGSFAARLVRRK